MMSSLKFILSTQLKRSSINKTTSGFTLIELLAAIILAVLVITPLMGFMISVMDSDRKEQAKATTEQETQAALDYISRDLEQALYIYDADGVNRISSASGIADQIPPTKGADNCRVGSGGNPSVCTPILVFWKRELKPDSVNVSFTTANGTTTVQDDGFAYSLVAYYLITNPNKANSNWSREARIGRFQITGAVSAASVIGTADAGYKSPPLDKSGANLKAKMNQWLADTANYTQRVDTLVDYISTTGPTIPNSAVSTDCPGGSTPSPQLIGSKTSGFFACVDADKVLAQVYIRGNALARVQDNNLTYTSGNRNYFPSVSAQIQGRGNLSTK
jgi:type II secretory pathway pseudopilin PulG